MTGTGDRRGLDDPVEAYLDELLGTLTGPPRQIRHTLDEVEAHLLDAVAAGRSEGLDEADARATAVRRLGPVSGLMDRPRLGRRLTPALRRRSALAALLIGALGGIAVGLGGLIGWAVQALWGNGAIAVPFPAGSYNAADCTRWLAGYPSARDCVAAMTADHADDFLRNAAGCGLLGLLALAGYLVLRRRWTHPAIDAALPVGFEYLLGVGLAGLAAVGLAGQGMDAILVTHGSGAGQPFSLAAAAVLAGAFFLVRARRRFHPDQRGLLIR